MMAKGIHLIHQVEDVKSVAPPRNEPNRAFRGQNGGQKSGTLTDPATVAITDLG
jgi:hypothetical protein